MTDNDQRPRRTTTTDDCAHDQWPQPTTDAHDNADHTLANTPDLAHTPPAPRSVNVSTPIPTYSTTPTAAVPTASSTKPAPSTAKTIPAPTPAPSISPTPATTMAATTTLPTQQHRQRPHHHRLHRPLPRHQHQ